MLIGMDYLFVHKVKFNCYEKTLECEDAKGNTKVLQGIHKPFSNRNILSLHINKFSRK
jgi:hypothetical protein